jgi:hypothetical protein
MKPWQEVDLINSNYSQELIRDSESSLLHWENCLKQIHVSRNDMQQTSNADLEESINRYRKHANKKFFYLPFLLSSLRIISPLYLKTWDDDLVYKCTYSGRPKVHKNVKHWNISMSRSTACFLFEREYGADTLSVSARFRCSSDASYLRFQDFFKIQTFVRDDVGSNSFLSALRTMAVFPATSLKRSHSRENRYVQVS